MLVVLDRLVLHRRVRLVSRDLPAKARESLSGEEGAGGLNAVLRIAGETNNGILNVFGTKISAVRRRMIRTRMMLNRMIRPRRLRTRGCRCGARFGSDGRWLDSVGHA